MSDPERIWLQNAADAKHQCEGRMWCEDKVWPDDPEDGEPTEYVRADIAAATIERLTKELEDALQRGVVLAIKSEKNEHRANSLAAELAKVTKGRKSWA